MREVGGGKAGKGGNGVGGRESPRTHKARPARLAV